MMRKIVKIYSLFIYFALCLFAWTFVHANDYEYKSLDITANIRIDGTIDVNETFDTNFFVRKHWIIRFIPLNYSVLGDHFHIDVSNISVNWSKFTVSKNNENLEIKIWDADKTVIWEQIYPIFYSVYWLIRNFSWEWYHELYWNLVWYDFDTNINSVRAILYLPKTYTWFTSDDFLITTDWITQTVKDFEGSVNWHRWDKITIIYDKKLDAWEWITLAIKFPNDYFEFDHDKQANLIWYVWENWNSLLVFLNLSWFPWKYFLIAWGFVALVALFLPKKLPEIKKSEIENRLNKETPIVVRYSPPDWINCAEAWMLYNCILEPTDLTSLVYKWLIEWLVSVEIENDEWYSTVKRFILTKLKNIESNKPKYEVDFFNDLLPSSIGCKKTLSTTSEYDVVRSLKSLRSYGKSKWWISVWSFEDSKKYIWFFIAIILFIFLLVIWINIEPAIIASAFVLSIFDGWSSSPTQKKIYLTDIWKEIALRVVWYARFLKMCDENKLRLFLKQDPAFFDKTLPYAVAFWFETEFIGKITPILRELDVKPVWYGWDINEIDSISRIVRTMIRTQELRRAKERESRSTYDRGSWFSSWSSFGWWFFRWWWGWWWGSRSW